MSIGVQTCVNFVSCFNFFLYSSGNPFTLINMNERVIYNLKMGNGSFSSNIPEKLEDLTVQLDFESQSFTNVSNFYQNLSQLQRLQAKKLTIKVHLLPDLNEHAGCQWRFSQNAAQQLHVEADVYQLTKLTPVMEHPNLHIILNENPSVALLRELVQKLMHTKHQVKTITCRIPRSNMTFDVSINLWSEILKAASQEVT